MIKTGYWVSGSRDKIPAVQPSKNNTCVLNNNYVVNSEDKIDRTLSDKEDCFWLNTKDEKPYGKRYGCPKASVYYGNVPDTFVHEVKYGLLTYKYISLKDHIYRYINIPIEPAYNYFNYSSDFDFVFSNNSRAVLFPRKIMNKTDKYYADEHLKLIKEVIRTGVTNNKFTSLLVDYPSDASYLCPKSQLNENLISKDFVNTRQPRRYINTNKKIHNHSDKKEKKITIKGSCPALFDIEDYGNTRNYPENNICYVDILSLLTPTNIRDNIFDFGVHLYGFIQGGSVSIDSYGPVNVIPGKHLENHIHGSTIMIDSDENYCYYILVDIFFIL